MNNKGKLAVVGIGPGSQDEITKRAEFLIKRSDCIVGYKSYLKSIEHLTDGKEIYSFGMKHEIDRCKKALELVSVGKNVVMVSSGDAGIYGMAGLVLELTDGEFEIEVVPGVTAASKAASLLGAPLSNDFAAISLSDLLTPWDEIEKRIEAASQGDFVIVFYNPGSKKRTDHLQKAVSIVLRRRAEETPAGIVEKKSDEKYEVNIISLKELKDVKVNMNTTVIIGNRKTFIKNGKVITKRGYGTE